MTYTSQYPTQDASHVKATSLYAGYTAQMGTDPALSLTGTWTNNQVVFNAVTNQRYHIDLSSAFIIRRIYYQNSHNAGNLTGSGIKDFTFWGSNSSTPFNDLTWGDDTGWTQLTIAQSTFDIHVSSDASDPKYILVTNSSAYQYYAIKAADNFGSNDGGVMGIRRVELQTEDGYVPPTGGPSGYAFLM